MKRHTIVVDGKEHPLLEFHVMFKENAEHRFLLELIFDTFSLRVITSGDDLPVHLVTSNHELLLKGADIARIRLCESVAQFGLVDGTIFDVTAMEPETLSPEEMAENNRILTLESKTTDGIDEDYATEKSIAKRLMDKFGITRNQAVKIVNAMIELHAFSKATASSEVIIIERAGLPKGRRIVDAFSGRSGEAPHYPEFRKLYIINTRDYSSRYYLSLSRSQN